MRTPATLGLYAAGLAAAFTVALGVGSAVGPVGAAPADEHGAEPGAHGAAAAGHDGAGARHGDAHGGEVDTAPVGLASRAEGYALELEQPVVAAPGPVEVAFVLRGPDGRAVTAYSPTHERELHLVLVRRDGTGFQHVHPERDAAGRWSTTVVLPEAGAYKAFVDTAPDGRDEPVVLAADLLVGGAAQPQPLPPVSRTAVVDGYEVTLTGDLVAGEASRVVLTVRRDGAPVTDLEPYLGAYGHLVSLRAGDLAYLHTHPQGAPGDGRTAPGPEVAFDVDVPSEGDYRLFLDFAHDGVVRTASFTAEAGA